MPLIYSFDQKSFVKPKLTFTTNYAKHEVDDSIRDGAYHSVALADSIVESIHKDQIKVFVSSFKA